MQRMGSVHCCCADELTQTGLPRPAHGECAHHGDVHRCGGRSSAATVIHTGGGFAIVIVDVDIPHALGIPAGSITLKRAAVTTGLAVAMNICVAGVMSPMALHVSCHQHL